MECKTHNIGVKTSKHSARKCRYKHAIIVHAKATMPRPKAIITPSVLPYLVLPNHSV